MPLVPVPDLTLALPEIALVCAAMALLLIGVFRGEGSTRLVSWLSVAVLIAILVLIGSAVGIILALNYNEDHRIARFEFPVLVLLATSGMMVMVSANDLITLY